MSTTVLAYLILMMGFLTFLAGLWGVLILIFAEVGKTERVPFRYVCDNGRPDIRRPRARTLKVHEQSNHRCFRDQFVRKPQGLRAQVGDEKAAPCDVAARSAHACNESRFDRIASARENNWNGGGRRTVRRAAYVAVMAATRPRGRRSYTV